MGANIGAWMTRTPFHKGGKLPIGGISWDFQGSYIRRKRLAHQ